MYFVVAGGLPLPETAIKDRSVPFPCMDSPCGCVNAEQCWASCCCHTPAERLAWGREHGLTMPRRLIVLVDTDSDATAAVTRNSRVEGESCCSKKPSCCESKRDCSHHSHAETKRPPAEDFSILGLRALTCHGFGTNWLTAVVAMPPVVVESVQFLATETALILPSLRFSSPALPPPVPPPRFATV
jgi:hypothetical protein